ncbi:hypothetical protein N7530_012892 [Penicillium desertorum]|uniref:Uncharacterized protein n=1 Tax=Penicillium desertorum TaxID=1303715 RepID=A0A9W9WD03_9EURO|nr:hypothetical protein N7530_012892 [Penicillium desertorum]
MPSGPSPPEGPREGRPLRPSSPGPPPPTMTMPYLLPRRGGLFTDPPPPGGGGWLYSAFYQRPRLPTCLERLPPSTPAPEPPAKPSSELANHQRSPYLPPIPAGGGLSTGHTGRGGHALHYPPLKRPAPRTARKACPFDPRFDPRPSRRANWPIPKGTISLPRARGLANDPPAGGTWLSSAYHPKPRRQIDRDGATPAKEGATLLGKTKAPGPIAPPPPAQEIPPMPPQPTGVGGSKPRSPPVARRPPFYAARMPPWLLNQLASRPTAQIRAQGPPSGFPLQVPGAAGSVDGEV